MSFTPDTWSKSLPDAWKNSRAGERIGSFLDGERKNALPMYKDKPSGFYPSRARPRQQNRRIAIGILALLALVSWWSGFLSPISSMSRQDESLTKWHPFGKVADWPSRAEKVKEVFKLSFADYEKHSWGDDEYHPMAKTGRKMTPKGLGWIIVDALDTMMLMNLTTELGHARKWIKHDLNYDQDHDVNTFETTIRMLGGLLSAHYLSTSFGGRYGATDDLFGQDLYIEKATELADRLMSAFNSKTGVPYASVNLHTMKGIPSHADGGASSTAEATSLQLEFKYLAKLTGEEVYWRKAEHVMKVIDDNHSKDGLVPIFIYADLGVFRGDNIRLGSRGDSYYEYLIKQYLQTSKQEPVYLDMWKESLAGIKKDLLTYSYPNNFTVLAERPDGLNNELSPKMDHLVCFLPGTIALAATNGSTLEEARRKPGWGPEQEENMQLAEDLMRTCWGMYAVTPTGLAGEITYFQIHQPPLMYNDFEPGDRPRAPEKISIGLEDFEIRPADAHNLQRPETAESLFYMWRITGDDKYRQWGWKMFESFVTHTATSDGLGFSSVNDVLQVPPPTRDNMESFWLVSFPSGSHRVG
ncbi:glycoside hydrolase family 47 protein [Piedraia hortae CBS 480.64]|uniref:alpha-1,2-Mannosidase n=1 Tax=Piedraia hortae CBS 480.64 TaxID=1314780 RepID=A0A6A7C7Y5_9PEZI|nr:glycoside hydrolase family 47 protein [Piedraia hortae CBS 480.64]